MQKASSSSSSAVSTTNKPSGITTEVRSLYEATLPVYVFRDQCPSTTTCSDGYSEAKLFMIKITISCNSACLPSTVLPSASSLSQKKSPFNTTIPNFNSLIFTLTDDNDLYFLYTAQIDECSYRNLKMSQRIKTDFSQFSSHLEQMFEMCSNSHSENKQDWYIKLSVNQGKGKSIMEIINADMFSESSKFHLELVEGSNEQKKEYLANQLKYWKQIAQENEKLFNNCDTDSKQKLEHYESIIAELKEEKQELLVKFEKEITGNTCKLKEEITRLKEKHLEEMQRQQKRMEDERREAEDKRVSETKALSTKLEEYRNNNNELTSAKFSLEADLRQQLSKTSQLENEKKAYLEEVTKLREQNRELDILRFDHEKKIRELETKLLLNEEIMKEKGLNLKTLNEHLKEKEQQELSKAEIIAELKSKIDIQERDINEKSSDLKRCHEIIKRFKEREDFLIEKEKERKLKMQAMQHSLKKKEQEKNQLIQTVEKRNHTIQELESNLRVLQQKCNDSESQLTEALKKVEQSQFTIDAMLSSKGKLGTTSFVDSLGTFGLNSSSAGTYTTDYSTSERSLSTLQPEQASKLDNFTNYYKTARFGIEEHATSTDTMSTPEKTNFTFSLSSISPNNSKSKSTSPTSLKKNIVSFETGSKEWAESL
ncbi:hypothetical protein C9374_007381 [Naegleria lovaniensis]|uniref:Spindle assembly abnormal protein 6 N-terminal domain-containing protein n=1 Tax=Naegleria lovaniensis TaxID=51637 RepID=A0AA88KGJ0_NAELO|nr:uncharacterized protein C9374_007381 [Naegleria lovaniensis]KAG2379242.1 hypothetical protein C9374_007381 [Naegleria lovaniensis]